MKNNNFLILVILMLVLFMIACQKIESPQVSEEVKEEVIDTGVLIVESFPSAAQVYVDGELKGDTPLTSYNMPVGTYSLVIKKDGYKDFESTITIKVGKTEEVDATLKPLATEKTVEEAKPENVSMPQLNKINLSSFAMYYDFDKMQFTETRTDKSDLFSRKYDNYVHFTALTPAKVQVINKPIKEVHKEDCIFAETGVAQLFSGQTLCVKTVEGAVAVLYWEKSPDELEWVLFS